MAVKLTDNRKVLKSVYQLKPNIIVIHEIPDLNFLVIENEGRREDLVKEEPSLIWMFSRVQNQLRSMTSKRMEYNFRHMPFEMIWHVQQPDGFWKRTVMVQVPEQIDQQLVNEAVHSVRTKNKDRDFCTPAFKRITQGLCAHTLHLGHYDEITSTESNIIDTVGSQGFRSRGRTREIYMNPPNWNPVENWQTIVRVPIERI
ncbi:GyrI-like domain-containing protein [Paenibacillus sp. HJGM_3]|uniref:GyrI-like domain-containing protein n=1 Tax=Paenibacillus sp. HJGM_3 TaxID=3379816 RepID=UPI0038597F7F